MKNQKPDGLQHLPTLKVEISNPDQAKQSNQLENKKIALNMPPPPMDLSKKDVILCLEEMKKTIRGSATDIKTLELIHIIDYALQDYAKCVACVGSGLVVANTKPINDYKVRTHPRTGLKYYLVTCLSCRGSGKQLSVRCASCGDDASIMPDQRHFTHCSKCETRLIQSGGLL